MTLLQSWADSLTLLKPKNLQLFVMVTIKSILEAYKLYIKYFWWLLLVLPLFLFVAPDFATVVKNNDSYNIAWYCTLLGMAMSLYGLLFLAACFATRPSILQKDCAYFRTQFKKIILYWLAWGALRILLMNFALSFGKMFFPVGSVSLGSPELIFFTLFFADSDGGLKNIVVSAWNTLKMVVYNLPLIFVFNLIFGISVLFFNYFIYISPLMKLIIGALLMPIGVCTYANIYIKKLHDQFDLYFKQPQ
jgi:hypothetical protein